MHAHPASGMVQLPLRCAGCSQLLTLRTASAPPPQPPNHCRNNEPGQLQKGMTFTIEPMFTTGRPGERYWPDKWTAVTADGSLAAQWEHTLLVTDDGVDVLTAWEGLDLS